MRRLMYGLQRQVKAKGKTFWDFTFCDVSQLKVHVDNVNSEIVENIIVIKELINIRYAICLSPVSTSECGKLLNILCTCGMQINLISFNSCC